MSTVYQNWQTARLESKTESFRYWRHVSRVLILHREHFCGGKRFHGPEQHTQKLQNIPNERKFDPW